jgi:RES domain-containing protein
MKIYRMHRSARAAANYTGAMEAGGRWNPIGTPMLYAAQHLSLACVEILVHLDKSELPRDYVWSGTELDGTPDFLRFEDLNHVSSCQAAGRSWARTGGHLAVQVPSRRKAVCPAPVATAGGKTIYTNQ